MSRWLPSFGLPVLCLVLLSSIACDRTAVEFNATGPAPLNANINVGASFGVEPATLRAEGWPGSCGTDVRSGVRLGVRIRGDQDVIVRSLRFSSIDRRGTSTLPEVIPIPDLAAPVYPMRDIPSSSPLTIPGVAPLPTATTIPIPGAPALSGVLITPGSHGRFDYFLRFGCIEITGGEIVIVVETADRNGRPGSAEVRARVEGS